MKELIKGQTIRIDNHDSGSGRNIKYDSSLHIHKVMNNDRYNGAEIIVPLNETMEISYRKIKGKTKIIETQLKNEIDKVFKKKTQKRKRFSEEVFKNIERYSQNEDTPIKLRNLINGANAIAKHFDLLSEIQVVVKDKIKNTIKTVYTEHLDETGNKFYIYQDLKGKNIRIGNDFEILNDWEKTKEIFNSEK